MTPEHAPYDALATARSFNRGCEARLDGRRLSDCPYVANTTEARSWLHGWRDVHGNWGLGVRGRWEFRPLPAIGRWREFARGLLRQEPQSR